MAKKFLLLALTLCGAVHAQTSYNRFGPAAGVLKGDPSTYYTTPAVSGDIRGLWTGTCNSSTYLRGDGSCQSPPGGGGGTVDSVGLTAPSVFSITNSPITTTGDIALDWATGQAANKVLASPNGMTGAVGLRSLVAGDIPLISLTTGVTGTLPVANGGSGAATLTGPIKGNGTSAFSAALAADIYGLWSGTCSSSTFLRGDGSCQTPAVTGAALTRTDDTNVTLTLGGTPSTALLQATSITAGWSGQLSVARGGSGAATLTGPIKGNGTSAFSAAASADIYGLWSGTCNSDTFLRGDGSCQTPSGGAGGANPTATVGLSAVNGVSTSFLRADGAPALSQSIIPTWTGVHTFSARPVLSDGITINDSARNVAALTDTAQTYGNTTDNPSYAFTGTGTMTVSGAYVGATATGGAQAAGSINATAIYDDGAQIVGANPSASAGLSAVNGSAVSYMRSDGAPAISQAISPTWTGVHKFNGSAAEKFTLQSADTSGDAYFSFYENNGSTRKGYIGYGDTNTDNFYINNEENASLLFNTNGSTRLAISAAGDLSAAGTGTWSGTHTFSSGSLVMKNNDDILSFNNAAGTGMMDIRAINSTQVYFAALQAVPMNFYTNSSVRVTIPAGGGLVVGAPTGGGQGDGTVNATGLYINGAAINAGVQTTTTATLTLTNASCTSNSVTVRFVKVGDQVTVRIPSLGCNTFNGVDQVVSASITTPSGYGAAVTQQFATNIYTGVNRASALRIPTGGGQWQWIQSGVPVALTTASTGTNGAAESTTFTYTLN